MAKIGVPKEILDNEYRVALTQAGARTLISQGHSVYVEKNAGIGSDISDEEYRLAGATVLPDAADVFPKRRLFLK